MNESGPQGLPIRVKLPDRIAINALPLSGGTAGLEMTLRAILGVLSSGGSTEPTRLGEHTKLGEPGRIARDSRSRLAVVLSTEGCGNFGVACRGVPVLEVPCGNSRFHRIVMEQSILPWILERGGFGRVFSLCNVSPLLFSGEQFVMVHDLHWFRLPWLFCTPADALRAAYVRRAISASITRADRIYAPSPHAAEDIKRMFGVTARVFPWGGRSLFYGTPEPSPIKGDYLLFVGQTNRRKNLARLAEAIKGGGFPPLVVAGPPGDGEKDLMGHEGIVRLGPMPDRVIHALYAGAAAFVYPSLYEGFGLPIIEAMASGCPVVTSRVSSMPFAAGGAAILVDPESPDDIRRGIVDALNGRAGLIAAGQARAAGMTMENAAAALVEDILS